MKVRLTQRLGVRFYFRIYWGDDCNNCVGKGGKGYHNAKVHFDDVRDTSRQAWDRHKKEDFPADRWPTACQHCGAVAPADVNRQIFRDHFWDTEDGDLHPGCMFFLDKHWDGPCHSWGDNCQNPLHLHVVLPNGIEWDIDSRANNCTMKDDNTHRCWVRVGEPPNVDVAKNGHTCAAGAGSIMAGDYHGHLRNGELISC